jgi:hypothetical protein
VIPTPIPRTLHGTPAPQPIQPQLQPPVQMPPALQTPVPQQSPYPQANSYPGWGPPSSAIAPHVPQRDATPVTNEMFERPVYPNRGSQPRVAGFERTRRGTLQPWVLDVGAIIMAALAFAITRAFIG